MDCASRTQQNQDLCSRNQMIQIEDWIFWIDQIFLNKILIKSLYSARTLYYIKTTSQTNRQDQLLTTSSALFLSCSTPKSPPSTGDM